MDETSLLKLPYIMPAQAQKHVTHNEALRMLDAMLHIRVEDSGRDEPPNSPAEGQRHLLGNAPAGAFAGQAGAIAAFQDGAWAFYRPRAGWVVWDAGQDALAVFDGEGWIPAFGTQNLPGVGVNTAADGTNRLAVAGEATLLTHDGAGHQLKINKARPGDTGSLLFQTGWSGRAEMGLAGSDDFSIKVSPDGAAWYAALTADRASGTVTMSRLGVGAAAPQGALHVAGNAAPLALFERLTTSGNGINTVNRLTVNYATGDMVDGFGGAFVFSIRDNAGVDNEIASFGAVRDGADNSGALVFRSRLAGAANERLRIGANGNVGVGTASPAASALLHLNSTNRGFLPPRMTTAQRDAIAAPAEGLVIYNLTAHEPQFWNGSQWKSMAG